MSHMTNNKTDFDERPPNLWTYTINFIPLITLLNKVNYQNKDKELNNERDNIVLSIINRSCNIDFRMYKLEEIKLCLTTL